MAITAISRFTLAPEFTEILTQCHIRQLKFTLGPRVGDDEGRMFAEIYSGGFPELVIEDCSDGIKYSFYDENHDVSSASYPWKGWDKALEDFDRIFLHHVTEEFPHPSFEWFSLGIAELMEALP
jgi:hypothetical protein